MEASVRCQSVRAAFTLVELLVVIAIIGVLAGLLLPALAKAKHGAARINEVNSARQMMLAWQMYADDHHGRVLPGYRYGFDAHDREGAPIGHPINARYPWRLAPYLADNFEILYVNRNRALLHEFAGDDTDRYTYYSSLYPSLGANSVFVGGDDQELPPTPKVFDRFGRFCVTTVSEIRRPSSLIAFASARNSFEGGGPVDGFYRVRPPRLAKRLWAEEYSPDLTPEQYGFVHPRFNERAVVAVADGHAEALNTDELEDMRRWANPAGSPNWSLQAQ